MRIRKWAHLSSNSAPLSFGGRWREGCFRGHSGHLYGKIHYFGGPILLFFFLDLCHWWFIWPQNGSVASFYEYEGHWQDRFSNFWFFGIFWGSEGQILAFFSRKCPDFGLSIPRKDRKIKNLKICLVSVLHIHNMKLPTHFGAKWTTRGRDPGKNPVKLDPQNSGFFHTTVRNVPENTPRATGRQTRTELN